MMADIALDVTGPKGEMMSDHLEALSQAERDFYEEQGYLVLENRIPAEMMSRIHAEIERLSAPAAQMTQSDDRLDLEDSHSPERPRIRRIKLPHTQSELFHELMTSELILAPVRDLLGADLRLHTSKLNMKSAGYGAAIEWHQDFAFYPHTNDDLLAVAVIIDDMHEENGPLKVFPGSHKGPIHNHHSGDVFAGGIDMASSGLNPDDAVSLLGPAGSVSIHHARIVHGSALNRSASDRRLLFYEICAADAFPIMGSMTRFDSLEDYNGKMLCGTPTSQPRLADVPVRIPLPQPDKNKSIYEVQKNLNTPSFETLSS